MDKTALSEETGKGAFLKNRKASEAHLEQRGMPLNTSVLAGQTCSVVVQYGTPDRTSDLKVREEGLQFKEME